MQPVIYNSDDTNAPQLESLPGTLNQVLKACLVTGYESKKSTNWQILFEDKENHILAICSKSVYNPYVLHITDNTNNTANVVAYKGWDSENNQGLEKFGEGIITKRWERIDDGKTPYYVILASQDFFYLFVQSESSDNNMHVISGFGRGHSLRNDKDFGVLMSLKSTYYSEQTTGYTSVQTNHGEAKFPHHPHPTKNEYFGDRSLERRYVTKTAIFSKFALYVEIDSSYQPALELPGQLLSFAETKWSETLNHLDYLYNQPPFLKPILGAYQPWHGRLWWQIDNWSASNGV